MTKDKLATIFGSIAGAAGIAASAGIHVGHIGSADFVQLIGAVAVTLLGYVANKPATVAK